MASLRHIFARDSDSSDSSSFDGTMLDLVIALLVLILLGLCLIGALIFLRRRRIATENAQLLPTHQTSHRHSHSRRLNITAAPYPGGKAESVYVYNEKQNLMENSSSPPASPIPEIRITFPDEEDKSGKRNSGRVVVVRISETGSVGMEPCTEQPPSYGPGDAERFHSLDLDRMGGLKEKEDNKRWS